MQELTLIHALGQKICPREVFLETHVHEISWFSCLETVKQAQTDFPDPISLCWRTMASLQYLVDQALSERNIGAG